MSPPRFILYSHDQAAGTDHLRRSLAIAAALTESAPDATVLLVTGETEPLADLLAANVDVLTLPAVRTLGSGRYSARRLAMSGAELREMRTAQIEAAVNTFQPDAMLVDSGPFGIPEELRPALESLRSAGGRAVLGLRDVLADTATPLEEWPALGPGGAIEPLFERVLVYGDRRVLSHRLPERLAARARYVGYVVRSRVARGPAAITPPPPARSGGRPLVLAAADGHEDGKRLLVAFVQAARDAAWDGIVLAGRRLGETDRHALRREADEAGVEFHVPAGDAPSWFPHADAVVCMGGYSAVAEATACGTPTLCVPSVSGTREQLIRARAFARLGLVQTIEPESVDARILSAQVAALLKPGRGAQTVGGRPASTALTAPRRSSWSWPRDDRQPVHKFERREGQQALVG